MSGLKSRIVNFDVDDYLNPYLRKAPLERLPKPISRFLGYRDKQQASVTNLQIWSWAFIGAFLGLLTIGAMSKYAPGLSQYHPPVLIASMGASAILEYSTIQTPLSQPRNLILGQTFSAIIGVCITKLFRLSSNFTNLEWINGALNCAAASFVMGATGTIYPPAGATAVLAGTNTQIINMGWMFIPFVLLDSLILMGVALLINNIQRQWPVWWWTSQDLKTVRPKPQPHTEDTEKGSDETDQDPEKSQGDEQSNLVVSVDDISVPDSVVLTSAELTFLRNLQVRIARRKEI